MQQTVNGQATNYTLDLNTGLTQVLDDGTNTYTYGLDRISQQHGLTAEYFLGDALGSVRQLTDASDAITLSKSYDPYGNVVSSAGSSTSIFEYTGEQGDQSGLTYLRARYYAPADGRFTTRDTWDGNEKQPITYNLWTYANANPVMYTDPSGKSVQSPIVPDMGNQVSVGISSVFQSFSVGPCWQWDQVAMSGGAEAVAQAVIPPPPSIDISTLSDFLVGFSKEAFRTHLPWWPVPWMQQGARIQNNESNKMLLGRLTADIISIAFAPAEKGLGDVLLKMGPAECLAGLLAAGEGELETCPGAAVQMVGAAYLIQDAVVANGIAAADGVVIVSMLRGRNGGGGGGGGWPPRPTDWKFGSNHSLTKWNNQMLERGWTEQQINEAIQNGQAFHAQNNINPGNPATRYVHPFTGRSVVLDDVTNEVLHIGGSGFLYP